MPWKVLDLNQADSHERLAAVITLPLAQESKSGGLSERELTPEGFGENGLCVNAWV
jgi:hypothetical protein